MNERSQVKSAQVKVRELVVVVIGHRCHRLSLASESLSSLPFEQLDLCVCVCELRSSELQSMHTHTHKLPFENDANDEKNEEVEIYLMP